MWWREESRSKTLIHEAHGTYIFVGSQRYPGLQDAMQECSSTLPMSSVMTLPSGKVEMYGFSTKNTPKRPSLAKLTQLATPTTPY